MRQKRKSSIEALNKMRSPNVWSPKKGLKRNPSGYNVKKKRKLSFSPAENASSSTVKKPPVKTRKNRKWRKSKGVWSAKTYSKTQELRAKRRSQQKHRRITEYRENLDELESTRKKDKP